MENIDPMKNNQVGTQSEILREYKPKCFNVKKYCYKEDINDAFKRSMEDKHFIVEDITNFQINQKGLKVSVFSVLDGHGGLEAVTYICNNLPKAIVEYISLLTKIPSKQEIKNDFEQLFTKFNNLLKNELGDKADDQGACTTILLVFGDSDTQKIFSINLGDSRQILIQKNKVLRLSYDHKMVDEEEIERIKKLNPKFIIRQRLGGNLCVTRALGDLNFTEFGLSVEPFVTELQLDKNEEKSYVVIASDGLWDVYSDKEVQNIIINSIDESLFQQTNLLFDEALKKTRDNIAVLIIEL